MSLIGIDVGSSSVKIFAYSMDGKALGSFRAELEPNHPVPGAWEQDPAAVWQAVDQGMRALGAQEPVRHDPPRAIAISASARENFPVAAGGGPLGPCIMGGDLRGEEYETIPADAPHPEPWTLSCGHLRERMDPGLRLLWWQGHHRQVLEQAAFFIGWHEFLTLQMCGHAVSDYSIASRWLTYDLKTQGWDLNRAHRYHIDAKFLPETAPWGTIIGRIKPDLAKKWGLSSGLEVAVGAIDLSCAALGVGAIQVGTACLCAGSFENLLIPTNAYPTVPLLDTGVSLSPYPGPAGRSIIAVSPTGTMVFNWARNLLGVPLETVEPDLVKAGPSPGPVLAVPYLSGSQLYWENCRQLRGGLLGMTLATSRFDIVRAFMESIAYEHVFTLRVLNQAGVKVEQLRAAGGGARSAWWTQLKADMLDVPIEVVEHEEPGTIGAAMLAGLAVGAYRDLDQAASCFNSTVIRYEPDRKRASLHSARLQAYHDSVATLAGSIYKRT